MGFSESVKSVYSKYATFSGRASRSEYWYYVLFNILMQFVLGGLGFGIGAAIGSNAGESIAFAFIVLYGMIVIWGLVNFLPLLATTVRRLHDTGKSGWLYLVCCIPVVGGILLLIFLLQESGPDNQYGPNPNGQRFVNAY